MNELMTLIDLCPGTRLQQYEPEIFANKELADYYLRKLCEQYGWYMYDIAAPRVVYRYASDVMKCRWPEAEAIIATHPAWAYYYARSVMKSRWPEAEHIIATDACWAYHYVIEVIGARWPEAEAIIATDPYYRRWYNERFGTKL